MGCYIIQSKLNHFALISIPCYREYAGGTSPKIRSYFSASRLAQPAELYSGQQYARIQRNQQRPSPIGRSEHLTRTMFIKNRLGDLFWLRENTRKYSGFCITNLTLKNVRLRPSCRLLKATCFDNQFSLCFLPCGLQEQKYSMKGIEV